MPLFDDLQHLRRADAVIDTMCEAELIAMAAEADREQTITLTSSQIALAGALAKQELQHIHLAPPETQKFLQADLKAIITQAKRATWEIAKAKGYAVGEKP